MNAMVQDPYCQEILKAALALAAQGIAVFPLKYATKEPEARSRGFYDATTNPATIRRWFGGNFKRNLGARTGGASGVWILDEDNADSLNALVEQHGPLPVTRQSRSSRGAHHWFKTLAGPIPCSASRVGPGLDVKAEGGYVVVPPSIHPDGVVYEWLNDAPVASAPEWLVELARKPASQTAPPPSISPRPFSGRPGAYGAAALRKEIELLATTPPGSRNHQLNRSAFSAFQLVAGGELSAAEVEAALIDAIASNGLLAEDGIRQCLATIRSGARAGMLYPRSRHGGAA
jgi:hypothetical protein